MVCCAICYFFAFLVVKGTSASIYLAQVFAIGEVLVSSGFQSDSKLGVDSPFKC